MYWARIHISYLRRWREAAEAIAKAVKSLGLDASVYVIGGAAEGRLTVLSDVDVLVCVRGEYSPKELRAIKHRVLGEAFDRHGLPLDYPIELHLRSSRECEELLKKVKHIAVNV